MAAEFYYIIFNPAAGSGTSGRAFKEVRQTLDSLRIAYEIRVSNYSGHAIQLAHQIGANNHRANAVVMVIGGDGTLNQTITGLRETNQWNLPIAYIPAGSGNDFARGIGMARNPSIALQQVLSCQEPVVLDIGHFTEKARGDAGYFVNNIGVGFDAAAVAAANRSRYKHVLNRLHIGNLAYLFGVVSALFTRKPFPVIVRIDGKYEIINRAFLCTTTNHPYFGGGVRILPEATPDDGQLDLIIVENRNFFHFVFLCLQLIRGKHPKSDAVHLYRRKHLQVETNSLEFGQMDGEDLGSRPFDLDFHLTQQPFWLNRQVAE